MEPQNIDESQLKKEKNKNLILKIAIVILLIIIVVLLFSIKNTKNENVDNNPQNPPTENTNNNVNNNQENTPKPEEKDKYIISYEEETYITKNNNGIITTRNKKSNPKITNEKYAEAAKQIEKSINTKINDEWKNNIISSADELNKEINNGELTIDDENYFDGLGAQISVSDAEPAKNILTFYTEVSGGFGGVGWFEYKGYNYDKTTGELLTLKTITNDYNELYKLIKHEIDKKLKELKKENDTEFTYENEKTLEELANKPGNWMFTEKGLDVIYQKYDIADGATGAITISIDKNLINEKLKENYQF